MKTYKPPQFLFNSCTVFQYTEVPRIIRNYYQQLYANKIDNVEEMGKFLEKCNFPKLNQE